MFARSFRRTVLAAAVALTLLVPAAQADDWARQSPLPLDPALANAIGDNTTAASKPLPLDPALRNVLVEASSAAGATAPQATAAPTAANGFAWSDFALGAVVAVASMLLLAALATGARSVRQRRGVNAGTATT